MVNSATAGVDAIELTEVEPDREQVDLFLGYANQRRFGLPAVVSVDSRIPRFSVCKCLSYYVLALICAAMVKVHFSFIIVSPARSLLFKTVSATLLLCMVCDPAFIRQCLHSFQNSAFPDCQLFEQSS